MSDQIVKPPAQVIVFPRGQLTARDKKALRGAGVIPVEADDPEKVVVSVPFAAYTCSPNDLIMSAVKALDASGGGVLFIRELYRRLQVFEAVKQKREIE